MHTGAREEGRSWADYCRGEGSGEYDFEGSGVAAETDLETREQGGGRGGYGAEAGRGWVTV